MGRSGPTCLNSHKYAAKVKADGAQAEALGIVGTPTFAWEERRVRNLGARNWSVCNPIRACRLLSRVCWTHRRDEAGAHRQREFCPRLRSRHRRGESPRRLLTQGRHKRGPLQSASTGRALTGKRRVLLLRNSAVLLGSCVFGLGGSHRAQNTIRVISGPLLGGLQSGVAVLR